MILKDLFFTKALREEMPNVFIKVDSIHIWSKYWLLAFLGEISHQLQRKLSIKQAEIFIVAVGDSASFSKSPKIIDGKVDIGRICIGFHFSE